MTTEADLRPSRHDRRIRLSISDARYCDGGRHERKHGQFRHRSRYSNGNAARPCRRNGTAGQVVAVQVPNLERATIFGTRENVTACAGGRTSLRAVQNS